MKTKVETYTYPNGQKSRETPYVNGQRHGISIGWNENGQKMHEIPYVNGQKYGLAIWWYENGKKKREIPYVKGKKHGLATWWNENGQKWYETPYVNGQVHGFVAGRFSDGSLSNVQKWHQDQLTWGIRFPPQGQIFENAEVELFFHETPELI